MDTEIEKVIITVGELIRILSTYNLTAKIMFNTGGSYQDDMQISSDDIQYKDDSEDIVTITI